MPLTSAERQARRRERSPEAVRAVQRTYYRRHRERLRVEALARERADREKVRARVSLQYAVRVGKIERPTVCAHDSASCCLGRIEGHHKDYARPLDVEWLCARHHAAVHRATLAA